MGWDEDNLGVVDCIWSNVGGHDSVVKDMVDPARCTSQQIPGLRPSWLIYKDQGERTRYSIDAEVTHIFHLERQDAIQSVSDTYDDIRDAPTTLGAGDESEKEDTTDSMHILRRNPDIIAKVSTSHKRMLGNAQEKTGYSAFLGTMDPYDDNSF